jgi:murein DD-endopeptidase MepM/ murein hydrolase activator NlpD
LAALAQQPRVIRQHKDWNEAILRYGLSNTGIVVHIPSDFKPRATAIPSNPQATQTFVSLSAAKQRSGLGLSSILTQLTRHVLLLIVGMTVLGNLPIYSKLDKTHQDLSTLNLPTLSPDDDVELKDLNLPAISLESYSTNTAQVLNQSQNWQVIKVAETDSLESLLAKAKQVPAIGKIFENPEIKLELTSLAPTADIALHIENGTLKQLLYHIAGTSVYSVKLTEQDTYQGEWQDHVWLARQNQTLIVITHSILRDAQAAGLSKATIHELSEVFRKDINFRKNVKVGDKLGVIYEEIAYENNSIATQAVIAAQYTTKQNEYQRIRFTLEDGSTDYFQPNDAINLKRSAFDRKPVQVGYVSSGFGFRRHPILGFLKAHTGVDFAAPYGTPIYATAQGSIKSMGWQGGYGNTVVLNHGNGINTLYGHMSAFNTALSAEQTLQRGDLIGYVGSTGSSTGNHVHYEFRINGEAQNPLSVELPKIGVMSEQDVENFKQVVANLSQAFAELHRQANLAANSITVGG